MQQSKYYHKFNQRLNQRLNQYGGVLQDLPIEIFNLITCQLNSCKDIILFAGTNKKTMDVIKTHIHNIVLYFKIIDTPNTIIWNEYVNTTNIETNYNNFVQLCKRIELIRLGLDIILIDNDTHTILINRDVDLTNNKIKIVKKLLALRLHNSLIIHALNNFNEQQLITLIFLKEKCNIGEDATLASLAIASREHIVFISKGIIEYKLNIANVLLCVIGFNKISVNIATILLINGINLMTIHNIISSEYFNNITDAIYQQNKHILQKIINLKKNGIEDSLLLEAAITIDTDLKYKQFMSLITKKIGNTEYITNQKVALLIIRNNLSRETLTDILKLIILGVNQDYAYLVITQFSELPKRNLFLHLRTINFEDEYAYLTIANMSSQEDINQIINYKSIGFTTAQAYTIKQRCDITKIEKIFVLIGEGYTPNMIYSIFTDGTMAVDTNLVQTEVVSIDRINNIIDSINLIRALEFNLEQAFDIYESDTNVETITLVRQHFNVDYSYRSRVFNRDEIDRMIELKVNHNFTEEYAYSALANLDDDKIVRMIELVDNNFSQEYAYIASYNLEDGEIDIMIQLKTHNIEDEMCYNIVTMDNYNNELKDEFIINAATMGAQLAYELMLTKAEQDD
jgi:hypothetical protein